MIDDAVRGMYSAAAPPKPPRGGLKFTLSRDRFCDDATELIPHPPHEWGQHSNIGGDFVWAMFQCPGHFTLAELALRNQIYNTWHAKTPGVFPIINAYG